MSSTLVDNVALHARLQNMQARKAQGLPLTNCVECGRPFSDSNCFTSAGRAETQISGTCEKCFDTLFADSEDEEE